jgi:2-dehydro-3-deoxygluconokinase
LGVSTDYVTALGDDPFSDEMLNSWTEENIGVGRVVRVRGKLPGLYAIRTSEAGERSFYYWRENSAARLLLDCLKPADCWRRWQAMTWSISLA